MNIFGYKIVNEILRYGNLGNGEIFYQTNIAGYFQVMIYLGKTIKPSLHQLQIIKRIDNQYHTLLVKQMIPVIIRDIKEDNMSQQEKKDAINNIDEYTAIGSITVADHSQTFQIETHGMGSSTYVFDKNTFRLLKVE